MEEMIRNLRKQKQLLEIELEDFANNKKAKRPSIHPETYYAKLAHAYKAIIRALAMLNSAIGDIYNEKSTKH